MSLNHLRIFKEVYQHKSITEAAKTLYISQPAVSRAIKEIEKQYHTILFERIGKKLYPTESASILYAKCISLLENYDTIQDALINNTTTIHIGSNTTISTFFLPSFISDFSNKHPNIHFEVHSSNETTLTHAIQNHEIDFALLENSTHSPNLISTFLINSPFSIITSKTLTIPDNCTLSQLASYPLLLREKGSAQRNYLDAVFESHQLAIHPVWESTNTEVLLEACKHNLGVAIIPSIYIKNKGFKEICLTDEKLERKCYLVYHKNKYINPSLQECIDAFIQQIQGDKHA